MLKDIRQERFLPEKEPLYKILQHMILWWVNLHQPSAPTSCTPHCPQWDGGGENKMKRLMGQEKDKETTHPLLSQAKQTSHGKEIF